MFLNIFIDVLDVIIVDFKYKFKKIITQNNSKKSWFRIIGIKT